MMRVRTKVVSGAILVFLLHGCSTGAPGPATLAEPVSFNVASQAAAVGVGGDYRLRPGDEVRFKFLFHSELDGTATVQHDGRITLGGLGDFDAAGATIDELEENVYRRASLTYRDPAVTVSVTRPSDFRAYVGGEVRRPGYVSVREGMSSLRAIFERGGFLDTAKVDNVLHVRWNDGGTYSARVVNLKRVLETGDIRGDVLLGPNDLVFVPKTAIANADLWVRQYLIDLIPIREPTTRIDDFRP